MNFDVLVVEGSTRIALAIVRTLGKKGLKIAVGDHRLLSMASASKYCTKAVKYPSPDTSIHKYHSWLINFLKNNNVKVYFPMIDATTKHAVLNQKEINKYTNTYLPNKSSYLSMLQKDKTTVVAKKLGINVPETVSIPDQKSLVKAKHLKFPVILKAIESSGGKGNRICTNFQSLKQNYQQMNKFHSKFIVSEYFPPGGDAIGVSVITDSKGNPSHIFVHRRLKQYPPEGGQSVVCESHYHEEAENAAIKLLKAVNYKGIALVEFKENLADRKLYLMEVNPRFWGSIHLPIVSGIDFPHYLFQLSLGTKPLAQLKYKKGIKCRWYSGDVLYTLKAPNKIKQLIELFTFKQPNTYFMDLDKNDLMPSLARFLSIVYVLHPAIFRSLFLPKPKISNKVPVRRKNPKSILVKN